MPTPTTSVIEIRDVGPIVYREIPLLPDGGVVVLRGENGTGKTTALNAVRTMLGADVPLTRRDGAERGSVSGFDTTLKVAKRQTRSGQPLNELAVAHVEETYDLASLVDPRRESEEAADMVRIKALVQLSGAPVDFAEFAALLPRATGQPEISIEEARRLPDPVQQAAKVKRLLDQEALRVERLADKLRQDQRTLEESAAGVDLDQPHDRLTLETANEQAIGRLAALQHQARLAADSAAARQQAEQALRDADRAYQGPTIEQAQAKLLLVEGALHSSEQAALDLSNRCKKLEDDLHQARRDLQTAQTVTYAARQSVLAARESLQASQEHESLIADLTGQQAAELPQPPDPAELAAAQEARLETASAIETGVRVRDALARRERAGELALQATEHEQWAAALRDAAKATDEVLSQAVRSPLLRVLGGRLLYRHPDGTEELFSRLSAGQRYRVAIQIGAQRVCDAGDGTRLLVLPQDAWQDLDPPTRDAIHDQALLEHVNILAEEVTAGPLRAEAYNPML